MIFSSTGPSNCTHQAFQNIPNPDPPLQIILTQIIPEFSHQTLPEYIFLDNAPQNPQKDDDKLSNFSRNSRSQQQQFQINNLESDQAQNSIKNYVSQINKKIMNTSQEAIQCYKQFFQECSQDIQFRIYKLNEDWEKNIKFYDSQLKKNNIKANNTQDFAINILYHSLNYKVVVLEVRIHVFSIRIQVYNDFNGIFDFQIRQKGQSIGKGNEAEVLKIQVNKQKFITKICPSSTSEQLRKCIIEYATTKLLSCFQIGPQVLKPYYFDVICTSNFFHFFIEECVPVTEMNLSQKQKIDELEQNLKYKLYHMHKFKIIHYDIKPENIMYSHQYKKLVFIDFGLAEYKKFPQSFMERQTFKGTFFYCSQQMKELFFQQNHQFIDAYANDCQSFINSFLKIRSIPMQFFSERSISENLLNQRGMDLINKNQDKLTDQNLAINFTYFLHKKQHLKCKKLLHQADKSSQKWLNIVLQTLIELQFNKSQQLVVQDFFKYLFDELKKSIFMQQIQEINKMSQQQIKQMGLNYRLRNKNYKQNIIRKFQRVKISKSLFQQLAYMNNLQRLMFRVRQGSQKNYIQLETNQIVFDYIIFLNQMLNNVNKEDKNQNIIKQMFQTIYMFYVQVPVYDSLKQKISELKQNFKVEQFFNFLSLSIKAVVFYLEDNLNKMNEQIRRQNFLDIFIRIIPMVRKLYLRFGLDKQLNTLYTLQYRFFQQILIKKDLKITQLAANIKKQQKNKFNSQNSQIQLESEVYQRLIDLWNYASFIFLFYLQYLTSKEGQLDKMMFFEQVIKIQPLNNSYLSIIMKVKKQFFNNISDQLKRKINLSYDYSIICSQLLKIFIVLKQSFTDQIHQLDNHINNLKLLSRQLFEQSTYTCYVYVQNFKFYLRDLCLSLKIKITLKDEDNFKAIKLLQQLLSDEFVCQKQYNGDLKFYKQYEKQNKALLHLYNSQKLYKKRKVLQDYIFINKVNFNRNNQLLIIPMLQNINLNGRSQIIEARSDNQVYKNVSQSLFEKRQQNLDFNKIQGLSVIEILSFLSIKINDKNNEDKFKEEIINFKEEEIINFKQIKEIQNQHNNQTNQNNKKQNLLSKQTIQPSYFANSQIYCTEDIRLVYKQFQVISPMIQKCLNNKQKLQQIEEILSIVFSILKNRTQTLTLMLDKLTVRFNQNSQSSIQFKGKIIKNQQKLIYQLRIIYNIQYTIKYLIINIFYLKSDHTSKNIHLKEWNNQANLKLQFILNFTSIYDLIEKITFQLFKNDTINYPFYFWETLWELTKLYTQNSNIILVDYQKQIINSTYLSMKKLIKEKSNNNISNSQFLFCQIFQKIVLQRYDLNITQIFHPNFYTKCLTNEKFTITVLLEYYKLFIQQFNNKIYQLNSKIQNPQKSQTQIIQVNQFLDYDDHSFSPNFIIKTFENIINKHIIDQQNQIFLCQSVQSEVCQLLIKIQLKQYRFNEVCTFVFQSIKSIEKWNSEQNLLLFLKQKYVKSIRRHLNLWETQRNSKLTENLKEIQNFPNKRNDESSVKLKQEKIIKNCLCYNFLLEIISQISVKSINSQEILSINLIQNFKISNKVSPYIMYLIFPVLYQVVNQLSLFVMFLSKQSIGKDNSQLEQNLLSQTRITEREVTENQTSKKLMSQKELSQLNQRGLSQKDNGKPFNSLQNNVCILKICNQILKVWKKVLAFKFDKMNNAISEQHNNDNLINRQLILQQITTKSIAQSMGSQFSYKNSLKKLYEYIEILQPKVMRTRDLNKRQIRVSRPTKVPSIFKKKTFNVKNQENDQETIFRVKNTIQNKIYRKSTFNQGFTSKK